MSGNERVLPGDRDLARDASGGHYRPKEAATARTIPDVGGSHAIGARHRTIACYLPTKRADCTKYFIVPAALRPDDHRRTQVVRCPYSPPYSLQH